MRSSRARVVLVTCPDKQVAGRLAEALVTEHLAACVNIIPAVESVFWWEGKLDRSAEVLLLIKTVSSTVLPLQKRVKELHPYAVPEIIAIPVVAGHRPYLQWVLANASPARRTSRRASSI